MGKYLNESSLARQRILPAGKFGRTAKSFTLLEIIIVVVIVGVLASFAVPQFLGAAQKSRDRLAQSQLALIQKAEQMVKVEQKVYLACVNTAACDTALRLDIPPAASGYWDYSVVLSGWPVGSDFCAQAANPAVPSWFISSASVEACTAGCPCP